MPRHVRPKHPAHQRRSRRERLLREIIEEVSTCSRECLLQVAAFLTELRSP